MKADQLSQTAAFVAVKFYGLTQIDKFRSLFDDAVILFYDRLVQTLPAPIRYYHFWLQFDFIRKLYIWSEELLLPGDLLHIIARKWKIQQMVDQHVEKGYEQLVVLGAGFDHLAYYYTGKGIPCFEFDTPYMAQLKQNFLKNWYPKRPHPKIIVSHLPSDQIGKLLSEQPEIDPQKKTIIVAEGFFDYLKADIVTSSLKQISHYFSHNPVVVCTHFALDELPFFHQRVFKSSVQLVSEKLQFDASMNDFKQLLRQEGFNIRQLFDSHNISKELHQHIHTKLDVLKGFYVLTAN